jgi:hypothetical protein
LVLTFLPGGGATAERKMTLYCKGAKREEEQIRQRTKQAMTCSNHYCKRYKEFNS